MIRIYFLWICCPWLIEWLELILIFLLKYGVLDHKCIFNTHNWLIMTQNCNRICNLTFVIIPHKLLIMTQNCKCTPAFLENYVIEDTPLQITKPASTYKV